MKGRIFLKDENELGHKDKRNKAFNELRLGFTNNSIKFYVGTESLFCDFGNKYKYSLKDYGNS